MASSVVKHFLEQKWCPVIIIIIIFNYALQP